MIFIGSNIIFKNVRDEESFEKARTGIWVFSRSLSARRGSSCASEVEVEGASASAIVSVEGDGAFGSTRGGREARKAEVKKKGPTCGRRERSERPGGARNRYNR